MKKSGFILIALLVVFFFASNEGYMIEELAGIGLFVYFLLSFIDSIGKSYNPFGIPILLALFQCMLMPTLVYRLFNDDYVVRALRYDMTVPEKTYFSYVFPAILFFIIALNAPLRIYKDVQFIFFDAVQRTKIYLKGKGNIGILLIIIGASVGFIQPFIPGELNYVAYLIGKLLIVGVLYTFFSDFKNRNFYLLIGLSTLLLQTLGSGMFGDLVFTLMLGILLVLLGKKISNSLKYGVAFLGIIFLLLIQSVKSDYRKVIWAGKDPNEQGQTAFFTLLADRLSDIDQFTKIETYFPMIVRANQGMIIGKVMGYVPASAPFAEGETVFKAIAASFVPRLLWPDKPMSGGHANMLRFTGLEIKGYSMNVSPIGEAYANFGVQWGIVFMFFYGLYFSVAIIIILGLLKHTPTLILWFPFLFLNSVQIETDVLMCVNSLLKNALFCWFCFWFFNRFMRIQL